jgi:hypothetical protein
VAALLCRGLTVVAALLCRGLTVVAALLCRGLTVAADNDNAFCFKILASRAISAALRIDRLMFLLLFLDELVRILGDLGDFSGFPTEKFFTQLNTK